MKTIRLVCWALAPVLALTVRAEEEPAAAPAGKILILVNDRVMEGDVEQVGEQYRVRRGAGETLIARARVKRLCHDWPDALAFMRSQANLGDPDEHLRLARWCQQHQLTEAALAEARAALEMRPQHAETKQFLLILQRSVAPATPAASAAAPLPKAQQPSLAMDLSADALSLFTTRVQPILMNACARCHSGGEGGGFQLQRSGVGDSRTALQRNLASSVGFLKLDNPAASPLLVKAVCVHGTASQPPIRDRRSPAFQPLLQWAEVVAANNPQLWENPSAAALPRLGTDSPSAAPLPLTPAKAAPAIVSRPVARADAALQAPDVTNAQQALLGQQLSSPPPPSQPTTLTPTVGSATPSPFSAADPFDPAGFNKK